jgi:hypothetical protein
VLGGQIAGNGNSQATEIVAVHKSALPRAPGRWDPFLIAGDVIDGAGLSAEPKAHPKAL